MQFTSAYVVAFIYNFAVVFSATWVTQTYNIERGWMAFAIAGLLGLAWTADFQRGVVPRPEVLTEPG